MQTQVVSTFGEFPDITWAEGSIFLTYQLGSVFVIEQRSPNYDEHLHEFPLLKRREIQLGGIAGAFGRVYAHSEKAFVAYRLGAEPYHGFVHGVNDPRPSQGLGKVHGMLPIVFGPVGYAWIAGDSLAGYSIDTMSWEGQKKSNVRRGQGTGLSRFDTPDFPILVDEDRHAVPGIADPAWAGPCVIGVTDREGLPCVVAKLPGDLECELWKGQDSPNPRIATDGESFYATAWSSRAHGIRLAKLSRADFKKFHVRPFGVAVEKPKLLGYFFGRRSKFGHYPELQENCAVTTLDTWQDGDGSLPSDVGTQLRTSLKEVGVGVISNTSIIHAAPEWKRVVGVFAGEQESKAVWAHEPTDVTTAQRYVNNARKEMDRLKLARRPVILILREDYSTDKRFIGIGDIIAPELYFVAPEATYEKQLQVTRARIREICDALAPSPLIFCVQSFDRIVGGTKWKESPWAIEAIQQAANEAIGHDQVVGLFWFAYARGGGVRAYPNLLPWHLAQLAVTPSPKLIVDKPNSEEQMGEAEVRKKIAAELAAARVPPDIAQGALIRFRNEAIWDRDKVGEDNITGGAQFFYFWPAYYAVMGSKLAQFGPPSGSAEEVYNKWAGWSGEGLDAAKEYYWQAQGKPPHAGPQ